MEKDQIKFNISPTQTYSGIFDILNVKGNKSNVFVLLLLITLVLIYYFVFSTLGVSSIVQERVEIPSPGIGFFELFMWSIFIFLILINGLQYFFELDIRAGVKNLFSDPEIDIEITDLEPEIEESTPLPSFTNEVYNIPENEYTYKEAKALCKAYEGRLATIKEIQEAQGKGAEWCNYGWSQKQNALFPTQHETWARLQKIKGHEHDCGRPGVNGGYIKNENVRFGVNCFGKKPRISKAEQKILDENDKGNPIYPTTPEEREMNAKVDFYKSKMSDISISPFNYKNWNKI